MIIEPQTHIVKINDKRTSDDFSLELIALTPKRQIHKYPKGQILVERSSVLYDGYITVESGTTIASKIFSIYKEGETLKIEVTPIGSTNTSLYEGAIESMAGSCRYKLTLVSSS